MNNTKPTAPAQDAEPVIIGFAEFQAATENGAVLCGYEYGYDTICGRSGNQLGPCGMCCVEHCGCNEP